MEKFKRIIIANGGYLKAPYICAIELDPNDQDVKDEMEDEEFESFKEYCEYIVNENVAEFEQKFAATIVLTPEEFEEVKKWKE